MTDTTPSPAPLRFALVPIAPIDRPSFCDHGLSKSCCWRPLKIEHCCADAEQAERDASPGNDLLQRIVRARDDVNRETSQACWEDSVRDLMEILNELGGGHGG